jgi:hypothetical protein
VSRARTKSSPALVAIFWAGILAGCQDEQPVWEDGVCDPPDTLYPFPADIPESSGVAVSRTYPGVFWTHNDSGWDPVVFAVDSTGAVLARVRVAGATNRDWEDVEVASCSPGAAEDCLFIGDIGDNNDRHPRIAVYRIPEPDPRADSVSAPATIIRATYKDGPRDAEALFVTDRGVHIINKGRSHAIHLYRIPPPYRTGRTTVLEPLQQLAPPPTSLSAQVTAAAASPDQRRVVVRTYGELRFFEIDGDTLVAAGRSAGLVVPEQRQGEGVDFVDEDRYVLTSEQQLPSPASIAIVRCDPHRTAADSRDDAPTDTTEGAVGPDTVP